jgi:hypothetical protein
MRRIIKSALKHNGDLITPAGEVIPCEVRKITEQRHFCGDLLWISLETQAPYGRHTSLMKQGYRFRFLDDDK